MNSGDDDLKVEVDLQTLQLVYADQDIYSQRYTREILEDPKCDFRIKNSKTGRYVWASGRIGQKILKDLKNARDKKQQQEQLSIIELNKCRDIIIIKLPNALLNNVFQFLPTSQFIPILASFIQPMRISLAKQYCLLNRINSQKIILYFKVITMSHEDGYCSESELYPINTYNDSPMSFYTMKSLDFSTPHFVPLLNKKYTFDGYFANGVLSRPCCCDVPYGSGYCYSYEELILKKVKIYKYLKNNNNESNDYSYQIAKCIKY